MDYPENWDDVQTAKEEGLKWLTFKSGESVKVRVVSGPLSFKKLYIELPGKDGKPEGLTIRVPFGAQIPGYKLQAQHALEVVVLDGTKKGKHMVWIAGQRLAEDLVKVKEVWGSIRKPDIMISREGEKKNTKWSATAGPASEGQYIAELDLGKEITFSTKADIDRLPPPMKETKQDESSLDQKSTVEQHKFISDLVVAKELTQSYLDKTIKRKFDKTDADSLTRREASELIDTLKSL